MRDWNVALLSGRHTPVAWAIAGGLIALPLQSASAQNFFCPSGAPAQGQYCTDGATGAFSASALSSQSISEISQSVTQQATTTTLNAVSAQRREEQERQPAATAPRPSARSEKSPIITKAPMPMNVGPRYGSWIQTFIDYEKRDGSVTSPGVPPLLGLIDAGNVNTAFDTGSRSTTGGFVGGLDIRYTGFTDPTDGLILGVLAGFTASKVKFSTSDLDLSGPGVGVYATYFRGGFSADFVFRADFYDLDYSYAEFLPVVLGGVSVAGSADTRLNNYTFAGNLNYRFYTAPNFWVEPTIGIRHTIGDYSSSAAVLGLADGHVTRLQGGARFGTDIYSGGTRITPTLTALLYSDVDVSGGFVAPVQVGTLSVITPDQEGELRAQAIVNVAFDRGNGFSYFFQGDVRGGDDLFGIGGKVGARLEW